jgi:DNA-binding NarL/FixJ family response regulator
MKAPINIFIVDDNQLFAMALKADIETAFNTKPIKISLFEIGEKCMDRFKRAIPEIVILDYYLNANHPAAANGIKVLEWIKKENVDTYVIMLTSDDNIDIAVKSFQHGASDYIVKTETKFKKINYSLLNLFNVMEARNDVRRYKRLLRLLFLCLAFFIGGVTAILIYAR